MTGYDLSEMTGALSDVRPACWLIAADGVSADAMASAADSAGLRIARRETPASALAALADGRPSALCLVEVGDVADETLTALLDILNLQATDAYCGAIVSCTPPSLDHVAARISGPYATLLCDPQLPDRIAALEFAKVQSVGLRDSMSQDALRLQQLTDEVSRIARALALLSAEGPARPTETVSDGLIGYRAPPVAVPSPNRVVVRADDIRTMVRLRRRRDQLFAGELFADPAWDMMLDLMIARIERLRVAVSSLCIAAAVPATTALRWIKTLTETGIFVRVDDPTDRRRVFIELSDDAARSILDLLGEAKATGSALV